MEHVSAAVTGTVDFPSDAPAPETGGTLDYPSSADDGTEALPGGTVDHVRSVNDPTEAINDGTVDHVPASSGTTDNVADAGHTVDPAQGKWVGTPQASKTAPQGRKKDAPPKTVAGYDILGVLGRGAMGVVYKARQRGLNRLVALKMILSGAHASEHELGRFRTEAEAVARIQHPNIVQIYEVGEEDGRPYFSLEFVDGGSLDRKIKGGKPLPPDEAARLVQALASGMDCAHRVNVIHRDLKPANVLLAADGTPKITDFGLAKRLEEETGQTHSGSILGTPSYMSPEQAEGVVEQTGPLADVWSLGAILYELLTGRVPFQAPAVLETIWQVRTREPVAPTELQPKVPRDLETICLKCLQKDKSKRYTTAGALAEDLRRFLHNEPILARPVGKLERTRRWCKRNPKMAALIGVVAAAVLGWASSVTGLAFSLKRSKDATAEALVEVDKKADEALANLDLAKKETEVARKQNFHVQKLFIDFGEALLRRLNARRFMQMGSEMRGLRDEMLGVLRDGFRSLAMDLEKAGAGTFGAAATHQNMGALLRRLGQGEEALKAYRLAYAAMEKDLKQQPDSDKGRANLAVTLLSLADMELELYGEPYRAIEALQKARQMRQEVADHPRSHEFNELENKIHLSHFDLSLGKAEMVRGDPQAALAHFKQAFDFRKEWSDAHPELDDGRAFLAEGHLWLGIGKWHRGDNAGSREAIDQSVHIMKELTAKSAKAFWWKANLADVLGDRGDIELREGKLAEAEKTYQESLKYLNPGLAAVPNHAPYQLQLAQHHERMAVIAARKGDKAEAKKDYDEAFRIRKELREIEPNNVPWLGTALRLFAISGRVPLAVRQLEWQYRIRPRSIPLLLEAARACAVGAATATDPATKQRYVEKAIGALHAAMRAGYKDTIALKTDPDLTPLQQEPLFVSLLARMRGRG
jgi:serine/threonine-protein kinase